MGWQDAPVVTGEPTGQGQTPQPAYMQAPVVQPPSTPEVAQNAAFKGLANLLNTPISLSHLIALGISNLPYAKHFQGLQDLANTPELKTNDPMDIAKDAGLVKPEREPQTTGQRVLDTAVQGGIAVAVSPAKGWWDVLSNFVLGATSGAAAQTTKELTGSDAAAIGVAVLTPLAVRSAGNALKAKGNVNEVVAETLKEGVEAGYVVPPSAVKPSFTKNRVESFGGKAAIAQESILRNQEVTNKLANKALGLPEDTALTPGKLEQIREQASKAYEDVANLPPAPPVLAPGRESVERGNKPYDVGFVMIDKVEQSANVAVLSELRQARHDAQGHYHHYELSGDPKALTMGEAAWKRADELEKKLEAAAQQAGKPELVTALRDARKTIAQTYDVERALNVGSGNVDAQVIGNLVDKGKPLTGELRIIGKFNLAFRRFSKDASGMQAPEISAVEPMMQAGGGTLGYAAGGPAGAAIGAGTPLLRGPARKYLLSKGVQSRLLKPDAAPKGALEATALSGASAVNAMQGQDGP